MCVGLQPEIYFCECNKISLIVCVGLSCFQNIFLSKYFSFYSIQIWSRLQNTNSTTPISTQRRNYCLSQQLNHNMSFQISRNFVLRLHLYLERSMKALNVQYVTRPFLFFTTANPVCGGQAGVQQVPHEDRPPLPVPLHLSVIYRQLQLR